MRFSTLEKSFMAAIAIAVPLFVVASRLQNHQFQKAALMAKKVVVATRVDSSTIVITPKGDYARQKQEVSAAQSRLKRLYLQANTQVEKKKVLDSAGRYLTNAIVNQLVPHWYGTPWSFEGYTETPKKGEIACGYFVSTVLNHAGLKINRFKMAQQAPDSEIKTLHQQPIGIFFNAESVSAFQDSVRTLLKEGLYIFGLSNHVGFLLHQKGQVYFIHSSGYFPDYKVVIEHASNSPVLYYPQDCRLGEITPNEKLVKQWLLGETVVVQQ
ncbi:hypothetical protein QNI19_10435 [Cytophagaceae bacterium DM2B3-1]|uniref:NlpC/P60 domain-containing protein n=1 Tax=Xanthocytophaga flava TaxID=3048013 RepID=A0ABT7CI44_9BACT|nr:hypothetical protein [Xanthocytophaga flavus]MDJ1468451.1 hypothetical protein [Xanthocytophaga flavus]MDJ1493347.1 hypothetical protein [Xanthocytophaga flavus]